MDKRNIIRKVRLTPEEDALFKRKAARYKTVSAMVRDAVAQFDDTATRGKVKAFREMTPSITSMSKTSVGLAVARALLAWLVQELQPDDEAGQRTCHRPGTHPTVLRASTLSASHSTATTHY